MTNKFKVFTLFTNGRELRFKGKLDEPNPGKPIYTHPPPPPTVETGGEKGKEGAASIYSFV